MPVSLGSCALVEAAGIDVLLNSMRSQAINTDLFTQRGCDLTGKQMALNERNCHLVPVALHSTVRSYFRTT